MKKHTQLKTKILISMSIIICLFAVLIVGYQNYASRNLSINNARLSLNRQSDALISRIADYVNDADSEIKKISWIASDDLVNRFSQKFEKTFRYFSQIKKISNILISVDPSTFFLLASVSNDFQPHERYLGAAYVKGARFVIGVVKTDDAKNILDKNVSFYDESGKNLGSVQLKDDELSGYIKSIQTKVDLQKKPKKSMEISKISKQSVLIDVQKLSQNSGYIYSEMDLMSLSLYLDANRITEKTRLFLIDDQKMLIAESILGQNSKLMTLESESMKLLKRAYEKSLEGPVKNIMSKYVTFPYDNVAYTGFIKAFPGKGGNGLNWTLVSTSPLSDLTFESDQIEFNSIIFALVLLVLILFWMFFYINQYSQPINYLGIEANKIRNFDLEDSINIASSTREIAHLTAEIENMKMSVRNFSHFIPKGLLEKLVNNHDEIEVGGKVLPVTLFFSDIANFTTISEKMTPNELSLHLSEYLEDLTGVISQNNGTIDKYIGDSIMAFWGAPSPDDEQIFHACRSALICQQKLQGLNRYWKKQNKPELVTRIGLHTGDAVVGNMGSSERMNYTAIGDTVNLAARLEGANKVYGTLILVSESIVRGLRPGFTVRPVDIAAVKGKEKGIKIYELVGLDGDSYLTEVSKEKKAFVEKFTNAFNLYLAQDWQNAIDAFEKLVSEDPLAETYINRCKLFLSSPPPEDWDGVMHLKEK